MPGERTVDRLTAVSDPAIGVTVHRRVAEEAGPHVVVLGGVHGNEVGGILAAGHIARADWPLLRGSVSVVPVAHEAARAADSRTSPEDGGNLARCFPGDPGGSPTERLAHLLRTELVDRADVLIDLHTASPETDMPLFVGCLDDGSVHATRGVELAHAFGLDVVWTHPTIGPGRTLSVAAEAGIPALYVESPTGGVVHPEFVAVYVDGVRSVLEQLGMVTARSPLSRPTTWLHGDGDVDSFTPAGVTGLFEAGVELLDDVRRGDLVGRVLDDLGEPLEEVLAPDDGVVSTLQRRAAVSAGQPLIGVTARRPRLLGLPSDAIAVEQFACSLSDSGETA